MIDYFRANPKFISFVAAISFLATSCSSFRGASHSSGATIDCVIAPATAEYPRNSEGDVVALKDGTLLAAWSRMSGRQDEATADIAGATSCDGGRTWSVPFVLQENIGKMNVMSVSFLRVHSGDILFFFLVKNSLSDLKLFVRRSTDEARTWSRPVVVTPEPGYFIMNNARAIQLKSGRILCPISFGENLGVKGFHLRTFVYYSDDNGHTWHRGKTESTCPKRGAMEPGLVELKDHRVLQIIRTELGEMWHSISDDGGITWSPAKPFGVVSPESPATVARMPNKRDLLLIYNPSIANGISQMKARTPLVASISHDEGKTWSPAKPIESDARTSFSYVSVTFNKGGALLTYYVEPHGTGKLSWKFKSIPVEWFRD